MYSQLVKHGQSTKSRRVEGSMQRCSVHWEPSIVGTHAHSSFSLASWRRCWCLRSGLSPLRAEPGEQPGAPSPGHTPLSRRYDRENDAHFYRAPADCPACNRCPAACYRCPDRPAPAGAQYRPSYCRHDWAGRQRGLRPPVPYFIRPDGERGVRLQRAAVQLRHCQ